jgi:NADPH2:quinone reductase
VRAVVCTAWGAPEALAVAELAAPEPADGEVAIDVHACSANFADLLMINGTYQTRPALPFVPGLEAAGRIARAPAGGPFAVGDRVVALLWHGGYAERAVAAAAETFALPAGMSFATAAALASVYTSADLALRRTARLAAGEAVLVIGAGGVALAAIQIAKLVGARPIALVSGPDRADLARAAGADHAICHTAPDWRAAVDAAAGPAGVQVCVDPVGGPLFDPALSTLGWGGRYVIVGFAAGAVQAIPANRLLVKHRAALGCSLRYFRRFEPAALRASVAQLFAWHAGGQLAPRIAAVLPLADTARGLRALADRRAAGKIIIAVRDPDEEPCHDP